MSAACLVPVYDYRPRRLHPEADFDMMLLYLWESLPEVVSTANVAPYRRHGVEQRSAMLRAIDEAAGHFERDGGPSLEIFFWWRAWETLRRVGAFERTGPREWSKRELPDNPREMPSISFGLRALKLRIERAPRTDDGRALVDAEKLLCMIDRLIERR